MRINLPHLISLFLLAAVLCSPATAQTEQTTRCRLADVDQDDDGLIEICNLNQLNEIRYQLDGTGYRRQGRGKITRGCPPAGCIGYELTRSLDFQNESDYGNTTQNMATWVDDGGWQPIGDINVRSSEEEILRGFSGVFEGNGYTISNLFINMENIKNRDATGWGLRGVGLFGFTMQTTVTTQTGIIRNIGLLNLRIEKNDSPQARPDSPGNVPSIHYLKGVGGLVGINGGKIINSYVSGNVDGGTYNPTLAPNNQLGRDNVGGLVGTNLNKIVNSYAVANTTGSFVVGGLVGKNCFDPSIECPANSVGEIINSYARGIVSARADGGGLVGANRHRVTNSYTDTDILINLDPDDRPEDHDFGGLTAINELRLAPETLLLPLNAFPPTITASYWEDSNPSLRDIGRGPILPYTAGQLASNLKFPDDATGIYRSWNAADWDFGTSNQYPALKYAMDENTSTCSKQPRRKDTDPPECGSLLPNQGTGLRDIDIADAAWTIPFSSDETDYTILLDDNMQNLSLRLNAYNPEASITIGNIGTAIGSTETTIPLSGNTILTVAVSDRNSVYRLRLEKRPLAVVEEIRILPENDITINADGTINENNQIILSVVAGRNYDFRWEQSPMWDQSQLSYPSIPSISVFIPLDFVDSERMTTRSLTFTVTVSDGSDSLTLSKTLIVRNILIETIAPLREDIDVDNDGLIEIYYLEDLDAIRYQLDGRGYKASAGAATIVTGCPSAGCMGYELARDLDFEDDANYFSIANKSRWTVEDYDDSRDKGWLPIGNENTSEDEDAQYFHTTFEGNGYTISNLQINRAAFDDVGYVGLFGLARQLLSSLGFHVQGQSPEIVNLGLRDVNIRGRQLAKIGGLVGECRLCLIINSYAAGDVDGHSHTGGLIGDAELTTIANSHAVVNVNGSSNMLGGLIGRSDQNQISNSYASGNVRGNQYVGGLIGRVIDSQNGRVRTINNSYASGNVTGGGFSNRYFGGSVGITEAAVRINNSYAIGNVDAGELPQLRDVGGFVGLRADTEDYPNLFSIIRDSYWRTNPDYPTGRIGQSGYPERRTAEMLQSPTDAIGIYRTWRTNDWDFGTETNYPILRYTNSVRHAYDFAFGLFGSDAVDTCDSDPQTSLPQCGDLLPNQRDSGLSALFILENGEISNKDLRFLNKPFSSLVYDYIAEKPNSDTFQIMPLAVNGDNATITITEQGKTTNYFNNRSSGDISEEIEASDTGRALTIKVMDGDISTSYILAVSGVELSISETFIIEPSNEDGTVNEGSAVTLRPIVTGGTEPYSYMWTHSLDDSFSVSGPTAPMLSFKIPEDFVGTDDTRDVMFMLTVNDSDGSVTSLTKVLMVNRIDNGPPNVDIEIERTSTTIIIQVNTDQDPDGDGDKDLIYQWQERRLGIDWVDINISTNTFVIPQGVPGSTRYRILITSTDAQNHTVTTRAVPIRLQVDDDGNNLIEIYYLEDLDAIRYQLDGSAYNTGNSLATKVTVGCEANKCSGYELARDLDFNEPEHYSDSTNMNKWRTDTGWQPIDGAGGAAGLSTTLEGNNLTISNLFINRPSESAIALLGHLAKNGKIQNMGLLDINIQGLSSVGGLVANNVGLILNSYVSGSAQISGNHSVGGLVGWNVNGGRIISSYADVEVVGIDDLDQSSQLGGLVGLNQGEINDSHATGDISGENLGNVGGLVGVNEQFITNSFATADVSGILNVGGLVGFNDNPPNSPNLNPRIANSFATGNVRGSRDDSRNLGGLIGRNAGLTGSIRNTYSNGVVSGHENIGGLFGTLGDFSVFYNYTTSLVIGTSTTSVGGLIGDYYGNNPRPIRLRSSYWQNDGSDLPNIGRGDLRFIERPNQSADDLKEPTTNTGIYKDWSTDDWDFGTENEYPILRYGQGAFGRSDPKCDEDPDTELPDCGPILGGQQPTLVALELEQSDSTSDVIIYRELALKPRFNPQVLEYEARFNEGTTRIRLTPVANHSSNTISYKIGSQDFQELSNRSFVHILMSNESSATVVIKVSPHSRSSIGRSQEYTIMLNKSLVKSWFIRAKLFLEGALR